MEYGWNGFLLEVPEEMRFTREGGNAEKGNLRFEAEDFFFEMKWEPFTPKKARSIAEVAEDFIKQMKKSKKRAVNVLRKDTTQVFKHKAFCLSLKSALDERLYMWYCDESKRVVTCHFAFKSFDEACKKMMTHAIETLKCHTEKSYVWSLLNFRFEIPPSFLLTDRKITIGRASFLFVERKASPFAEKSREILVEYFSMANLLFEDTYRDLRKWFEKNYMKDLKKRYRQLGFQSEQSRKFKRHDMVIKQGKSLSSLSSLTARKTSMRTNATWYCSRTNRIYSLTISSTIARPLIFKRSLDLEAYKNLIEEFFSSFMCH